MGDTFASKIDYSTHPTNLCEISWALNKAGIFKDDLRTSIRKKILKNIKTFKGYHLSRIASLWAEMGDRDPHFFKTITREVYAKIDAINIRDIRSIASSLKKLEIEDLSLTIRKDILNTMHMYEGDELSRIASIWAEHANRDLTLFKALSFEVCSKIDEIDMLDVHIIASSFAKLRIQDAVLFKKVGAKIHYALPDCDMQTMIKTAWNFAILDIEDRPLFEKISDETCRQIYSLTIPQLGSLAWSFARLDIYIEKFFENISFSASSQLFEGSCLDLYNIACAFAKLNVRDTFLFEKIAAAVTYKKEDFTPLQLSNIAWAFATLKIKDPKFFEMISIAALLKMKRFYARDLALLAWSFASLEIYDKPLCTEIQRKARFIINEFTAKDLADLIWALSIFDRNPSIIKVFFEKLDALLGSDADDALSKEDYAQIYSAFVRCSSLPTPAGSFHNLKERFKAALGPTLIQRV
jgi:hypothetical protein